MINQLEQAAALPNIMANPLAHVSFFERFLTGVMINGYGLFLTLFPFKLACDYQFAVFPTLDRFYDPRFLLALAALLSVLVGGLACLRRKPLLFVAMTIFLGFSFLISNIPVAIGIPFAERLYYTPSLALSFVVAHAIQAPYAEDRFRKFFFLFLGVWMVFASAKIVERSLLWKDDRTLYTNDIQVQPRSSRLHYQMADFAMFDGDAEKQFYHMEQAFLLKPEVARAWLRFAWFLDDPSQSLEATRRGLSVAEGGGEKYKFHLQWTRANEFKTLKQSSSEQLSRKLALKDVKILLADAALRKELRELLADNPPAVGNWYEASALLARQGEFGLAEACLREGLEASEKSSAPHRFQLHWALAHNLLAQEQLSEAKDEFEALVHEDPARVRQNLESLRHLQATDDGAQAFLSVLNTGMELEPTEPLWALYRGLLDVELGNVKEARIDLERAIQGLEEHPRLEEAKLALQELETGS
jgi:tetratricopeptide (TPR) repeat protein